MDPVTGEVMLSMEQGKLPSRRERSKLTPRAQTLCKQWRQLNVQDGVLYRITKDPSTRQKRYQFVLPAGPKDKALSGVHDLAGHQGQARTPCLAKQRFFWSKMERDIREYVKCCK